MDIPKVLNAIRPNSEWSMNGDAYEGLVWLDDSSKPSEAEIEQAWPSVAAEIDNDLARHARQTAFRDEADPLFFGWQRGENTEQEWLDKCEEIRQRFPYVPVPPLSGT